MGSDQANERDEWRIAAVTLDVASQDVKGNLNDAAIVQSWIAAIYGGKVAGVFARPP